MIGKSTTLALAAASLLALQGCISLLPETEPDTLYRLPLSAVSDAPAEGEQTAVILGRIVTPRGLAGDRIALQRNGAIGYMAGAAWLSPAPTLLYSAMVDTFHATAPAIAPARAEDGVSARYQLDLELRHFEAIYDQGEGSAPLVRASIRARLIDRDTRAIVGAHTVSETQRASANRQAAIVDAFGVASSDMTRSVAVWTQGLVCESEDAPSACP